MRLLGNRALAEDATQEVFLKVIRDLEQLRDPSAAPAWIYAAATRHCLNLRRDTARFASEEALPQLTVRGDQGLAERQLSRALLARFDEQTRLIAVGVLVDELEQQEVGLMLGISSKTVSRKLTRFLESARKYLARSDA